MAKLFKIVLDAGHGGNTLVEGSSPNNAAAPNGLLEKDLTLKIAQIVSEKLPKNQFQTFLTRDKDVNLSLKQRAGKSREVGADAFVSIHFNASRKQGFDGTEVFISESSDEKDYLLAEQLLRNISGAASIGKRGIREVDFTVLKGKYHVAKTAACLVEMAYLTNPTQAKNLSSPDYIEKLASAVIRSIVNYTKQSSYAQSLADENNQEKLVFEVVKEHEEKFKVAFELPKISKETDVISFEIPKGLKMSRWEVEVLATSTGAGYKVTKFPPPKSVGNQTISVEWNHLPFGKINYKLKVYASSDGIGLPEKVYFDSSGWMEKSKDQIAQGIPFQVAVKGEKAKKIYEALRKKQGENAQQSSYEDYSISMFDPVVTPTVIIVGIVIFGVLVLLGMLTLGAIIKMALDKGYNVKDTKYKAGVGEGATRQDHEIAFNIVKPTEAKSESFGLVDELNWHDFRPLDNFQTIALGGCDNPKEIPADAHFVEFGLMKVKSDLTNHEKNVCLRWNEIPANTCEIDVVCHFHGYDIRKDEEKKVESFFKYVEKISGLDLKERKPPTLCILPFGDSKDNWKYFFPFFNSKDGLKKLIEFSLKYLADKNKLRNTFSMGRLILTAHSGGGAAVSKILDLKNAGNLELEKGKDINEVHLFDATYDGANTFGAWAEKKINLADGALRVLYRACGNDSWKYKQRKIKKDGKEEQDWYCDTSETETKARSIGIKLDDFLMSKAPALRKSFRVEETKVGHNEIPKTFGFQLLANASVDLKPQPVKATDKLTKDIACCRTFPNCVCRGKPSEQSLAFYDENEVDYFADREASFRDF